MTDRVVHHTLTGREYAAPDVFAVERERIFYRHWFYAGRAELVEAAGRFVAVEVAGESVLVVRGRDGLLRGFYNVCRHRGSRLCDDESGQFKGAIRCPYHAWSYGLDGGLIGTPHVGPDELDRDELSLWPIAVDVWEGFLFVCLAEDPVPLAKWLAAQDDPPVRFDRFGLGALRIGHRTLVEPAANWKIVIENYNECLHCPTVHPELVRIVPAYRSGGVVEEGREDGGVALVDGGTSFTLTGRSRLPVLPGVTGADATSYFGCVVFPNMFIDITGTGAIATSLQPVAPDRTRIVTEYLFHPDAMAAPDFDPTPVVDFSELVAGQDYEVCERVQRGVSSRAFTRGVLAEKDDLLHDFNERYLAERGPVPD